MEANETNIAAASRCIENRLFHLLGQRPKPMTALILGSGLSDAMADLQEIGRMPYNRIDGFPQSPHGQLIAGHAGMLKLCELKSKTFLVFQGRFHYYEGYSLPEVTLPVRALHRLGIKNLIVTNAAGGIGPMMASGSLMLLSDHINMMGVNPLRGMNLESFGPRFPDMSFAYDAELQKLTMKIARQQKLKLQRGVYVAVAGPSYETPAEILMFKRCGAHAVGMSTVPEVIVANHQGMRVVGFSMIANKAAGLSKKALSHAEVVEVCKRSSVKLGKLICALLKEI